jgi:hypothetical protein
MDFITGLPEQQSVDRAVYDSILIVVDRYSKIARYIVYRKTIDSPELTVVLWKEVFSLFGTPKGIVSDRGTVFTSRFWSALYFHLYINQRLSIAFHPQTNGQTKHQNQSLEHYLRAYCGQRNRDWLSKLPFTEFMYNNSIHQVTQATPFKVYYGYNPQLPYNSEDRVQGEVPAAKVRAETLQTERSKLQEL